MDLTGYLAPAGYEELLLRELKDVEFRYGRLFFARGSEQKVHWVQNIWKNPQMIQFNSISEGAKLLRSLGSLWAHYPFASVRRAELIGEKLPFFSKKPLIFPSEPIKTPLGSWMLLDDHTLIASPSCSSPFFHGEVHFEETKIPPSRAYLKLWEFYTRLGCFPKKGERCLEIGASPGGWTWALQKMGLEVIAVDRSPLSPEVALLPGISFLTKDAFSLTPDVLPKIDWLFSDVVCYPKKLLKWLQPWLKTDLSIVCTLKFQGEEDYSVIREFEQIEGSGLIHLFHNKHELTWYRIRKEV